MSLADIIQIIIGVLSLVATIAVSFLIYWLQSRHEKEIQKLQCEKAVSYTHLDVYKRQNMVCVISEAEKHIGIFFTAV